jgi:hypothetical protein
VLTNLFRIIPLVLFVSAPLCAQTVVRYVTPEHADDPRHLYALGLLSEALDVTDAKYGPHSLVAGPKLGHQQAMVNLKDGKNVDVIISMTSAQLEEIYAPVRVPLFKGLIGTRVLLIHKKHARYFNNLPAEQLKQITMVQGLAWPDTKILKAAGYNVIGGDIYTTLFPLLNSDEPRAFPRAVHEVRDELAMFPDLEIAKNAYFSYPAALYFFVKKDNEALARRIEDGLMQLHQNGTFEKRFKAFLGDRIAQAKLEEKQRIELANPVLPALTPVKNAKLWFSVRTRP